MNTLTTIHLAKHTRKRQGTILIEGVAGIITTITLMVACLLVLVNVLVLVANKVKLGIVANAAVAHATRLRPGIFHTEASVFEKQGFKGSGEAVIEARQVADMEEFVNNALARMALPPSTNFKMDTDASEFQTMHLSFSVTIPTGIGPVTLKETASAMLPWKEPPSILWVGMPRDPIGGRQVMMPSYGPFPYELAGNKEVPKSNLPTVPTSGQSQPPFSSALRKSRAGFRTFTTMPKQAEFRFRLDSSLAAIRATKGNYP